MHLLSPGLFLLYNLGAVYPWVHILSLNIDALCYLLGSSYSITLELCTLGTRVIVDSRYTCYLLVSFYALILDLCTLDTRAVADSRCICYLQVPSFSITLELCTLGTHTVVDPRNIC